ncbi:hypothetical protein ACIQC5_11530 [Paenarthrobacter sp. NPDC092416]|uniref:hypothetical protein n=1 Tax=Paenarthrobacter sp. NPDC092416 TaxID=3364386 RepID=UPI00382C2B82
MMNEGAVHSKAADWLFQTGQDAVGDVLLASPFLSYDVCKRLAQTGGPGAARTLFTCLDPSAVANGYLSVDGLLQLIESGFSVRHVDRLHAKAFLLGSRGFLGSANLTGAGLGSSAAANVELGVELGAAQVSSVRQMMDAWTSRTVTPADLDSLALQARQLTVVDKPVAEGLDSELALALVEQLLVDARDSDRTLWLKSEYGEPALDQWRKDWFFGSPAKGRPSIKEGDLVVISAQTRDCYAVVEVTSEPLHIPDDYRDERGEEADRWPWVSRTKPRFVPDELLELKAHELVRSTGGLQNGHIRLKFDQFTYAVRSLARLVTD